MPLPQCNQCPAVAIVECPFGHCAVQQNSTVHLGGNTRLVDPPVDNRLPGTALAGAK
jgi:hypothetical protein